MMMLSAETNAFGVDKVARYGWAVTSNEGEFRKIHKRLLNVNNEIYQRDAIKTKVMELASKWSWIACGALVVAHRDGVFWVVDGQHRKLAADRRSDIKELPCMVFEVSSVKSEARAFLDTNGNRKPVSAFAKFRALLAAGDSTAELVNDVIVSSGLRFATASSDAGDFKSVALAIKLASTDKDGFIVTMKMAAELALAARAPVHQRLVAGLYYIHTHIDGGLEEQRLAKRLRQVGADALVKGATSAAAYYAKGGNKVYADGMMNAINKGLHKTFELTRDSD